MIFQSTYDPELAVKILERVAAGETLTAICDGQPGMPHSSTFKRWLIVHPDLARAYGNAITASALSLEEEALDTARQIARLPKDSVHVRAAQIKLGQLQWSAERRDASKYGTRTQVSIKVPIQIITPLNLGAPAEDADKDIYTLEATTVEETPPLLEPPVKKVKLVPGNPFYAAEKRKEDQLRKQGSEGGVKRGRGRPRKELPKHQAEEGLQEAPNGDAGSASGPGEGK